MTDLAEGQFQFSMRSHQKEGSFQVFCIQVNPKADPQPQLQFQIHPGTQNLRWKSALHQMLLISLRAPVPSDGQPPVATTTTSADRVLDQFQQKRSMISTFLGARQDPTPSPRLSFCNYLDSEIENLEERDFLTFRNETMKLLNEIQYKAEEHKRQVTTSQEVTTYQLPEASQTTAGCEYILTILETQLVSIPVVQPQQTTTGQPVTVLANH